MFDLNLRKHDWVLFGVMIMLAVFGLVMIFSTTLNAQSAVEGRGAFRLQVMYLLLGLFLYFFLSGINYRILQPLAKPLFVLSTLLLFMVLLIGSQGKEVARWFDFGIVHLQPAEIAKLTMVIVLSSVLAGRSRYASSFHFMFDTLLILLVPIGLILIQPDLGTAMIFIALWLGMMVGIGVDIRYLFYSISSLLAMIPLAWPFLKDYQKQRLISFIDPASDPRGSGYNAIQAKIAVGAGGILGVGLGQGTQSRFKFLPVRHTDFIFSVVAEELGIIGASILLVLFALLLLRILRAAAAAQDNFGRYLSIGFFSVFLAQIFINIGMNISIMPVTGVPLPFISYGGSSLWLSLAMLGFIQSIVSHTQSAEYTRDIGHMRLVIH
ncbi:MAG TPA: rod shape-determining protein RodA [bacterium]|nr:rod shape-determining protein RodA [bacterium]